MKHLLSILILLSYLPLFSQRNYIVPEDTRFIYMVLADTNKNTLTICLDHPVNRVSLVMMKILPESETKTYNFFSPDEIGEKIDTIDLRLNIFDPNSKYIIWVRQNRRNHSSFSMYTNEDSPILY